MEIPTRHERCVEGRCQTRNRGTVSHPLAPPRPMFARIRRVWRVTLGVACTSSLSQLPPLATCRSPFARSCSYRGRRSSKRNRIIRRTSAMRKVPRIFSRSIRSRQKHFSSFRAKKDSCTYFGRCEQRAFKFDGYERGRGVVDIFRVFN